MLPASDASGCGEEIKLFEYGVCSPLQLIRKVDNIIIKSLFFISQKKKVCKIYKPFLKVLLFLEYY
jgi:hypothetical protein